MQAIFWTGRLGHLWLGSSNNASRFNYKTILMISPDLHLGPTLVPNRTGMRETESTVGRSSIQVCYLMGIMPSVLLLMLHLFRFGKTRKSSLPNKMQASTCCMTLWSGRKAWASKYTER